MQNVIEFYNQWGEYYEEPHFMLENDIEITIPLCEPISGNRILEIGSGTGRMTIELLKRGGIITAVEPAPTMRKKLKEKCAGFLNNKSLFIIDSDLLNFKPQRMKFDILVFPMVIDHIERLEDVFMLADTVLKKRGKLIISGVNPYYLMIVRRGMVYRNEQKNRPTTPTTTMDVIRAYYHSFSALINCAKKYKFKITDLKEATIDEELVEKFPDLQNQIGYAYIYASQLKRV